MMKIIGSVIARIGSKRLTYKNLLPYRGEPLVLRAVRKLVNCSAIDEVVLSTDSELIARTCIHEDVRILWRPESLAGDQVASVPVFQHIVENFDCDLHVNYNCNFPECEESVVLQAIDLAKKTGEALSNPFAVWAQTRDCLDNYIDPFNITAALFDTEKVHPLDIHTMDDLLQAHREHQDLICPPSLKKHDLQ
jgi:CMP-2-keto-3-deoxyoctulosonic acid synthetase